LFDVDTVYVLECQGDVILPDLASGVVCYIPETCTGVSCCIEDPFINKTFNAYVFLDPCNFTMTVGIERLSFLLTLYGYVWGIAINNFVTNTITVIM
jgi:hypothetical protein